MCVWIICMFMCSNCFMALFRRYNVMMKCWTKEPHERPTISALISELQNFLDASMVKKNECTKFWLLTCYRLNYLSGKDFRHDCDHDGNFDVTFLSRVHFRVIPIISSRLDLCACEGQTLKFIGSHSRMSLATIMSLRWLRHFGFWA